MYETHDPDARTPRDAPTAAPAPAAPAAATDSERAWACVLHLSSLLFLALPVLGLAGPLFVWMFKYDESRLVDHHGRICFDFGLTLLICWAAIVALGFVTCGLGLVLLAPLAVYAVVATIVAAVHAKRGEYWRHPLTVRVFE